MSTQKCTDSLNTCDFETYLYQILERKKFFCQPYVAYTLLPPADVTTYPMWLRVYLVIG